MPPIVGTTNAHRKAGPTSRAARGSSGGIGRRSTPTAEAVSDQLRRGEDPSLTRRRRTAALALAATGSLGVVSLYQVGILKHIPEPPGPFNADKVDASGEAYSLFNVPDGLLGMLNSTATAVLATMGTVDRARTAPWIPLLLAAKVGADTVSALFLTAEQATRHREYCAWCLVATVASMASLPLVIPEARAALRHLRN